MKCEECKAFIRQCEDGGICAFTDIGIVMNEDGKNCRQGQIVTSIVQASRAAERKRIVMDLEEEKNISGRDLNYLDYIDGINKAIGIVEGGENEKI